MELFQCPPYQCTVNAVIVDEVLYFRTVSGKACNHFRSSKIIPIFLRELSMALLVCF